MGIELQPIVPKTGINAKLIAKALDQALDATGLEIKKHFERTTATWTANPPGGKFMAGLPKFQGRSIADGIEVFTRHQVYYFVNFGTKRNYPIRPRRRGGSLKFRESYRAKTRTRRIGSTGGGKSGNVTFRKGVTHPGVRAREFDKTIVDIESKMMEARIQGWITRASK